MRDILETAVRPDTRLRLDSALAEGSRKLGPTNEDVAALDKILDAIWRSSQRGGASRPTIAICGGA